MSHPHHNLLRRLKRLSQIEPLYADLIDEAVTAIRNGPATKMYRLLMIRRTEPLKETKPQ